MIRNRSCNLRSIVVARTSSAERSLAQYPAKFSNYHPNEKETDILVKQEV